MKQTAQGLAALGRGPDTELIHMTKGEVAGLQALAMKHGGSLTINPDTGLPEAGFLSSILPMVVGAGLMAAGVPAPMAGLLVGGGTAVASGSLQKGLMAGLGAYGGAGMAEGLMGAGTGALSSAAGAGVEIPAGAIVPQVAAPAVTQAASGMTPEMLARGAAEGAGKDITMAGFNTPQVASWSPASSVSPVATTTAAPQLDFANAYSQDQAMQNAVAQKLAATTPMQTMGAGITAAGNAPGAFLKANAMPLGAMGLSALLGMEPEALNAPAQDKGMIRPYTYSREKIPGAFQDVAGAPMSSRERRYFTDQYTAGTPYAAPGPEYKTMANGGPVEAMSNANAIGANTGYPQADVRTGAYASPFQRPMAQNVIQGSQDAAVDPYTGQATFAGGGGVSDLGGYSDGGRLLRGPGDGVSDSIPAMIGQKQQARLADGEFVVPARIVSELGNGSTEAGARQLYAMMDRVQKARKKSIGKDKVATNSRAHKLLPA